ncbi:MAG: polyhydroxyalkanoate synthesis repressor PhaR [Thalassobaculaceae bacterium]
MTEQKPKSGRGRRPRTTYADQPDDVVVIKKYANRRLYNTASSSYVTLDNLCQMIKDGDDFVVFDAKTGEDITRAVLTQIIVEEEAKGQNMLPINFLRQLIRFYGDSLQMVVPSYLEQAMINFAENQDSTRNYMQQTLGGLFSFQKFEDLSKQNMAMFEQAMKMFMPPPPAAAPGPDAPPPTPGANEDASKSANEDAAIPTLKAQVDLLQRQLDALSDKKA